MWRLSGYLILKREEYNIKIIVIELSRDHKPDLAEEMKRIKMAGGKINDGRINKDLNLSRALGDFEYKNNFTYNKI